MKLAYCISFERQLVESKVRSLLCEFDKDEANALWLRLKRDEAVTILETAVEDLSKFSPVVYLGWGFSRTKDATGGFPLVKWYQALDVDGEAYYVSIDSEGHIIDETQFDPTDAYDFTNWYEA